MAARNSILAHFESLKFEASRAVNADIAEDDVVKDIGTEVNKMPVGKLLKAKGAKTKGKTMHELAPDGVGSEDDDVLKIVKEINMDSLCTTEQQAGVMSMSIKEVEVARNGKDHQLRKKINLCKKTLR